VSGGPAPSPFSCYARDRKRPRTQDAPLGPHATITLAVERQASSVDEILAALDRGLVGCSRSSRSPGIAADFAPYGLNELMAIGRVMIEQAQYYLPTRHRPRSTTT
jgi:hypothetical protein